MSGEAGEDEVVELRSEATPELQAEARKIGWTPPDRYKGDPEKFVDAEEFIRRGEEVLPIVRARMKEFRGENEVLKRQLAELQESVKAGQESTEALHKFYREETTRKIEQARRDLKAQIREASKDGDHEGLAEATAALSELDSKAELAKKEDADAEAKKKADAEARARSTPTYTPAMQTWIAENDWFQKDGRKTALAMQIGKEIRLANANLTEEEFFVELDKELAEYTGAAKRPSADKTGSGRSGAGQRRGGKTFADLPADAKAACGEYEKQLVGKGKRFETKAAWQEHYAKTYFEDQ